ncbi:probable serine/threonine-protein kinase DDB_G0271682 [Dendronephthya gigantea]|uniref:probable serine/threonine-protein kinase DDB_G0271682 n=1 Tax=Dendronephthya gigantea TaxID=151771 RepID=UPI00106A25C1|nr:probable serine/threonine-protein kinase DDB_G0271682 [Dendronephthya gigantea]
MKQLRQEQSAMATKNRRLEQEKVNQANGMKQLRQEKNAMATKNRKLEQEKVNQANRMKQLRQEKSAMAVQIQQYKHDESDMADEIKQLQDENATQKNIMQKLEQEKNNMKIEVQQLQDITKSSFITESGTVVVTTGVELGKGAYGKVYKGNCHGTEVAVKEYFQVVLNPHNMKLLEREINIAAQCRHPNLLQFLCATKNDQKNLLIVTELMDISLRSLLEEQAKNESRLDYQQIKLISLDVARGLNYLHSKKPSPIIHRDVSSANVLLMIENNAVRKAKVSDYGSANFMEACNTTFPGSVVYAPPEARQGQHSPKIDVYCFGLLVCETDTCELPDQAGIQNQIRRIQNAEIKDLVKLCTAKEPRQRPTMQEIIEHLQQVI